MPDNVVPLKQLPAQIKHVNVHVTEGFGQVLDALAMVLDGTGGTQNLINGRGIALRRAVGFFNTRHPHVQAPIDLKFQNGVKLIKSKYSLVHGSKDERSKKTPINQSDKGSIAGFCYRFHVSDRNQAYRILLCIFLGVQNDLDLATIECDEALLDLFASIRAAVT